MELVWWVLTLLVLYWLYRHTRKPANYPPGKHRAPSMVCDYHPDCIVYYERWLVIERVSLIMYYVGMTCFKRWSQFARDVSE